MGGKIGDDNKNFVLKYGFVRTCGKIGAGNLRRFVVQHFFLFRIKDIAEFSGGFPWVFTDCLAAVDKPDQRHKRDISGNEQLR
jgi:hypothetical protein